MLKQSFAVTYHYNVYFTKDLFNKNNLVLLKVVERQATGPAKILVIVDEGVANALPKLCKQIEHYAKSHSNVIQLCESPILISGSEVVKNDRNFLKAIYQHINDDKLCRHSYLITIGGGALLDAMGFVAATAHRGIRLIRVPSTVLGQDDSGVGVKNGINYFGKKNWIGTFAPPYSVINDFKFIESLGTRDWLAGLAEAMKVSLIKDASLFYFIKNNADKILKRNEKAMQEVICRSAELHLRHIGKQGDPFEMGSSRPLDFGHWSAHKLEQITNHRLRHGEAVAIGVAIDATYSFLIGMLPEKDWRDIIDTMKSLHYEFFVPELELDEENLFKGLQEFREHLGGQLTIMMLEKIGRGREIHEVDFQLCRKAIQIVKQEYLATTDIQQTG
jgi:3-dehydroquinate synthase